MSVPAQVKAAWADLGIPLKGQLSIVSEMNKEGLVSGNIE